MLILGAHRHSGLKDYLYGETVNSVRHELQIPVLIVNMLTDINLPPIQREVLQKN